MQQVVDVSEDQDDGDFQVVTVITAEDIRPDLTAANSMCIALQEMSTCKGMFDKWAEELDRTAPSERGDLEDELFAAVDELRDQAALALESSATIVHDHETFAQEMTVLLESCANNPNGDFYRPMEVMAIGDTILDESDKLAVSSMQMQEQLDRVLELVESIRAKQERRLLWRKVLKWLFRAFQVLSVILSVGAFVLPIMIPTMGDMSKTAISIGATLAGGAAKLCKRLEMSDDEEYKFTRMLEFLRDQVPIEAERASKSLQVFQACHRVLQVDVKVQQGQCVRINQSDAQKARNEWRAHRQSLQQVNQAFQRARSGPGYSY